MPETERNKALESIPAPLTASDLTPILTKVAIRTLCEWLHCEVTCHEISPLELKGAVPLWISTDLIGELQGNFAVGCSPKTLSVIFHKGSSKKTIDYSKDLQKLFQRLGTQFVHHLERDDFSCTLKDPPSIQQNFSLPTPELPTALCRFDTKFGPFYLYCSLTKLSAELIAEQFGCLVPKAIRKIRVNAHQIELLYDHIKLVEEMESNLLSEKTSREEIQSEIKRIKRIVHYIKSEPIHYLFEPAHKAVKDIAKQLGKQVNFQSVASPIYLDKALLNHLYSPILHLVRNAIDHGIEDPIQRERVGKPATGQIKCLTSFSDSGLRFVISDDGQGVDFQAVRDQAVNRGILDPEQATHLLSHELYKLLFKEHFSTKDRSDFISGSGNGLWVVKQEAELLGGKVRLIASSHRGTSFELTIPLNEEFGPIRPIAAEEIRLSRPEDERIVLLDELQTHFDRLDKFCQSIEKTKKTSVVYEAYRLLHSIRGITGFLRWDRVVHFCQQVEELFKAIAEQKIPIEEKTIALIKEAAQKLIKISEAYRDNPKIPSTEIKRMEGNILKALWTITEDKRPFSFSRLHLDETKQLIETHYSKTPIPFKQESDFEKAYAHPFGTTIQFEGERAGYASLYLDGRALVQILSPIAVGSSANKLSKKRSLKNQLETLNEFSVILGRLLLERLGHNNISVQFSKPVSYTPACPFAGLLDAPTYCYSGELGGHTLYLLGHFDSARETSQSNGTQKIIPFLPSLLFKETQNYLEKALKKARITYGVKSREKNWDLVGFTEGMGLLLTGSGKENYTLVISLEHRIAHKLLGKSDKTSQVDWLEPLSKQILTHLGTSLKKNRISLQLSSPAFFSGRIILSSQLNLVGQHQYLCQTPYGKIEIQVF